MLKSIYKTGSSLILSNPNDEDLIYYYETNEERLEALVNNQNHFVNIHFRVFGSEPRIFLGCYIYPFMKHIEGDKIDDFITFNICEHKKEYKEIAMKFIEKAFDIDKRWYHILIACYMFENNENAITEEQREVAKLVHDEGITKELKEYCINILNEIE